METKNSGEILNENAKLAGKWFSDVSSSMMEIYKKQLDQVFDFYSNLLSPGNGTVKNGWNPMTGFSNAYVNGNGGLKFFNPMAWLKQDDRSNPFTGMYENFYRQLNDNNAAWMKLLQKNFQSRQNDWSIINEKYQRLIEKRWEATRGIIDVMNDSYNKQLNFSMESNKALQTQLNKVFNELVKSNEEFWRDISGTFEPVKEEREEKEERTRKPERKDAVMQ